MDRYRITAGSKFQLAGIDPDETSLFDGGKKEARKVLEEELNPRLEELQDLLYAEGKRRVLIVLQGMDTSGKDGTIRSVFNAVDPLGIRVASFKVPSAEELAHDYLWRVHRQVPGNGEIVIFNRSHYEDVLVVRVHKLVPKNVWSKRFDQINDFERMLAASGTTIVKFFLHISSDEQKARLEERRDTPEKRWKFSLGDLDERKLWDDYQSAYQDVLRRTSTEWAPWYVVPANAKWYRNIVIANILIKTLESLDMKYPPAPKGTETAVIE
ncbi:MAG: polyphosphate kinase 2 family protein [Acidobacteria bacterium]|nr:polyphosphate kinase 2 family protein [Acidobacteriota bacterium]